MLAVSGGMLVAVNIAKYRDCLLMRKVNEVKADEVMEWLVGIYSGMLKEWNGREEKVFIRTLSW